MICWKKEVPLAKQLLYWRRLKRARLRYFDSLELALGRGFRPRLRRRKGYQSQIAAMRDRHAGQRCFIIGNGPSLKDVETSHLRDEVTIGCNGVYKKFEQWGFSTNYLVFEDVEQFEIRAPDLEHISGPMKLAAIYNSYAVRQAAQWCFFNSPRCSNQEYYFHSELYPQFSRDFASIVHLGGTVTYIMLQLAYFLGCKEVYLLGVDHNYGPIVDLFEPGKIAVTEDNIDLVRKCHFDPDYYQIGDVIGVPFVEHQEQAYRKAHSVYMNDGRTVTNVTRGSRLDVFPTADYDSLFEQTS